MNDSINRDVWIDAPVERVWAVLTDASHVSAWFAFDGARIDLRPGGELTFRWKEHGEFHGRVERVEPPRFFSFRWARPAGEPPGPGNATLVEFTLTPDGGRTHVRVVESGFRDLPPDEQAQAITDNTEGWRGAFRGLADYLAKAGV